jgi:hypothetical protein
VGFVVDRPELVFLARTRIGQVADEEGFVQALGDPEGGLPTVLHGNCDDLQVGCGQQLGLQGAGGDLRLPLGRQVGRPGAEAERNDECGGGGQGEEADGAASPAQRQLVNHRLG